jgi:hypothetical protein
MKVEFKDTFFESVQKLVWYDTKLWKFWQAVRYDIPSFLKNIWRFRKELYSHRWYDYRYTLEMLHRSLVIMESKMHDGMEVAESRDKKIAKMQRAIQILKNIIDDNYIEMAEAELGELIMHDWQFEEVPDNPGYSRLVDNETPAERKHNRKVYDKARRLGEAEWKELWRIFEGQNYNQYKKITKSLTPEQMRNDNVWVDWFDGTDMRGWWD